MSETNSTLKKQILLGIYLELQKDSNSNVGSATFSSLGSKAEVIAVLVELRRDGLITYPEPISTGMPKTIQRILDVRLTKTGERAAQKLNKQAQDVVRSKNQ